jgi:hypothetical protein
MASFYAPPGYRESYRAPSSSTGSSSSVDYDYSGLEEHQKKQDQLAGLRDKRFDDAYNGNVAGAVTSGNQIRDLLAYLQQNAPGTTLRNPMQIANPLVKVKGVNTHESQSNEGASYSFGQDDDEDEPTKAKRI